MRILKKVILVSSKTIIFDNYHLRIQKIEQTIQNGRHFSTFENKIIQRT